MPEEIKLRVTGIEKTFPGVRALGNINFSVRTGTVHALCGENGAGKSTLMKIIDGIYKPDAGEIFIDGKSVKIKSPLEARNLGIAMIAQELNYVPEMSVEENLFLGHLPVNKYGKIKWKEVREKTVEVLRNENLPYKPTDKLKTLTVSDIQMLEITKAVSNDAKIIVMDEPTSAITQSEVEVLFKKIALLKEQGVTIIYISHKMDEVFRIADDITVLRDGEVVTSVRASDTNIDEVIAWMVGRKLDNIYPKEDIPYGEKILEVENLCSGKLFENISFYVRRGEIVGFAGLVGSGRTEVMSSLFGLENLDSGVIRKDGKDLSIRCVPDSISAGMAMLSEDRRRYGIIPMRSIKENVSLASLKKFFFRGYFHSNNEKNMVKDFFSKMNVKSPSVETPIQSLSGGNQQKVLLSRWMMRDPDVLILDEPTRGIDVGAKFEIYKLMMDAAKAGRGIIMVSSELPELIGMCDRIYVMCKGRLSGELSREDFSQQAILQYAMKINGER